MPAKLNLDGQKYGRLTVLKYSHNKGKTRYMECLCDCGNIKAVAVAELRSGGTKSCGCLARDILLERNYKHGNCIRKGHTKEYIAFHNIISRTSDPKRHDYHRYGGRGITFQWKDDFEGFLAYIGKAPNDGQLWSVERIDVNGNYEEGNIRWATATEQNQNKRKQSNNTSGKTGVAFHLKVKPNGKSYTVAVTQFQVNGKKVSKSFSVLKYGLLESFAMACAWRDSMIREMNEKGLTNYTENHGK